MFLSKSDLIVSPHPLVHNTCTEPNPFSVHPTLRLQCVYCNNMEIDYTAAAIGGGYKEGDVVRLSQGQDLFFSVSRYDDGRINVHIMSNDCRVPAHSNDYFRQRSIIRKVDFYFLSLR